MSHTFMAVHRHSNVPFDLHPSRLASWLLYVFCVVHFCEPFSSLPEISMNLKLRYWRTPQSSTSGFPVSQKSYLSKDAHFQCLFFSSFPLIVAQKPLSHYSIVLYLQGPACALICISAVLVVLHLHCHMPPMFYVSTVLHLPCPPLLCIPIALHFHCIVSPSSHISVILYVNCTIVHLSCTTSPLYYIFFATCPLSCIFSDLISIVLHLPRPISPLSFISMVEYLHCPTSLFHSAPLLCIFIVLHHQCPIYLHRQTSSLSYTSGSFFFIVLYFRCPTSPLSYISIIPYSHSYTSVLPYISASFITTVLFFSLSYLFIVLHLRGPLSPLPFISLILDFHFPKFQDEYVVSCLIHSPRVHEIFRLSLAFSRLNCHRGTCFQGRWEESNMTRHHAIPSPRGSPTRWTRQGRPAYGDILTSKRR